MGQREAAAPTRQELETTKTHNGLTSVLGAGGAAWKRGHYRGPRKGNSWVDVREDRK